MITPIFWFILKEIPDEWIYALLSVDAYFACNIALHLSGRRLVYQSNGELVTNPGVLRSRYARRLLPVDLLSNVPLDLIIRLLGGEHPSPFWRLNRILRFYHAHHLLSRLEQNVTNQALISIGWLVMMLSLGYHWVACIWLSLGSGLENGSGNGWVQRFAPSDEGDAFSLYWRSQYWTVSTILTIGYGDVVPSTDEEVEPSPYPLHSHPPHRTLPSPSPPSPPPPSPPHPPHPHSP